MNILKSLRRILSLHGLFHRSRANRIYDSIQIAGLVLKDLPFLPHEDEVYYVSNGTNAAADRFVEAHLKLIKKHIEARGGMRFVYLPTIGETLAADAEKWRRAFPDLPVPSEPLPTLTNDYLLQFRANKGPEALPLPPGFVRCCHHGVQKTEEEGCFLFSFYPLDEELALKVTDDYLDALSFLLFARPCATPPFYSMARFDPSDPDYDERAAAVLQTARESVMQLRRMGIRDVVLKRALFPEPKLSPLHITTDNRILLPDFDNMEIVMEPLDKAFYFLFLRHPEGIPFKLIADYREELAVLYDCIKHRRPLRELLGKRIYLPAIMRLTTPTNNALNERASHIARAFGDKLDKEVARFYTLQGDRGLPKFVTLPPEMVVWESSFDI